jgi:hypothetical protein
MHGLRARECVRLAGLTDEPEIRDHLFALSREWMAAAMQEARPADLPHQQLKVFSNVGDGSWLMGPCCPF